MNNVEFLIIGIMDGSDEKNKWILRMDKMDTTLEPIAPGELLQEEFLTPMGISHYRLAKEIGVPTTQITQIIAGKHPITTDIDHRLCHFFGLSDGYWLRAQAAYETKLAERNLRTS